MRLKVSPRIAIKKIDDLVRDGYYMINTADEQSTLAIDPYADLYSNFEVFEKWTETVTKTLGEIFQDYIKTYNFQKIVDPILIARYSSGTLNLNDITKAFDLLAEYYNEISKLSQSPLFYVSEKAQICFLDSICQLEPDSNESNIVKFLFENSSFGEWISYETIADNALGIHNDEYDNKAATSISNAYDGINKKTKKQFGFSIVSKSKSLLSITIPARFLTVGTNQMA